MSWWRWLLCGLLLLAVEGSWLYLLLGVAGFVAGLGQSPLPYAACVLVPALAGLTRALRGAVPASWPARGAGTVLTAVVAVWLAVAMAPGGAAGAGWPLALLAGHIGGQGLAGIALSLLAALGLWHLGQRRLRGPFPSQRMARSFRAGLVAFVTVALLESAGGLDLGTRAALVPFFAFALAGLAVARAPTVSSARRMWLALVAVSTVLVMGVGTVLAVLAVALVRGGGERLRAVWLDAARALTASVSDTLAGLLGGADPGGGLGAWTSGGEPPQALMLLVLLAGAVVMAWLARRLLSAEPRDWPAVLVDLSAEERERLPEPDTPPISRLVDSLASLWGRRRRETSAADAVPGVVAQYRRLLAVARRRGLAVRPAQTPYERARELRRALPGAPVDAVTELLVSEVYAGRPPPEEALARVARALDRAEAQAVPGRASNAR